MSTTPTSFEQLDDKAKAELKKCATERLQARLVRAGLDEDAVFAFKREQALEAMAQIMLAGTGATGGAAKPQCIWERELQLREREFELRQHETQEAAKREAESVKLRQRELDEAARREAESVKLRQRELELKEREMQEAAKLRDSDKKEAEARWNAEHALRTAELERQKAVDAAKQKDENSLVGRTRKFAEAIKHVFPSMPSDNAELPSFFETVDNLFKLYAIPVELHSKLLLPRLTEKARALLSKLTAEQLDDYAVMQKTLLTEFKLTPRELRSRFMNATKRTDESYALFAARLESLLSYYLRSRDADKDPVKMFGVFVADKLKDTLAPSTLHYVLSLEGDGNFTASKVAATADIYASNYDDSGIYRGSTVSNIKLNGPVRQNVSPTSTVVSRQPNVMASQKAQYGKPPPKNGVRACYLCSSTEHIKPQCPLRDKKPTVVTARAQACMVDQQVNAARPRPRRVVNAPRDALDTEGVANDAKFDVTPCTLNRVESDDTATAHSCQSDVIGLENNVCELAPLSYIDVCINGVKRTALVDGGSEIPLIRADVLGSGLVPSVGSIIVQPIIGPGVHCKLSAVDVTRYVNECQTEQSMDARPVHIVFAVTNDMVGHDVVLPASVVDQLKDTSQIRNMSRNGRV